MAERKARLRCDTEIIKLKVAADCVTALSGVQEGERKPDVAHFGCKINVLETKWDTFEASHDSLYSLVTDEDANGVKQVYQEQLAIYTLALDKGKSLEASLHEAGPTPLKEKVEDCLLKRTHLTAAAEWILEGVFAILRDETSVPGRATLQAQQGMLDEAKQNMVNAAQMTTEAVLLDYEHASSSPRMPRRRTLSLLSSTGSGPRYSLT